MSNAADDHGDDDLDGLGNEGEELPEVIHVADDLSEYVEKERYKAIFEAKREAAETLREYGNPAALASNPAQLQMIREKVSAGVISYITEIRRILEETENGRELWQDTEIETLPVSDCVALPGEVTNISRRAGLEPVEHRPQPDDPFTTVTHHDTEHYYVLGGVADYLALHDTEAQVTIRKESAGLKRGSTSETVTVDPYPPVPLSRDVYQKLTRLLTDTGLDVELGEPDDDEWEL
jgi:hypothetical protein